MTLPKLLWYEIISLVAACYNVNIFCSHINDDFLDFLQVNMLTLCIVHLLFLCTLSKLL
jgi:hypothetical protein